MPKQLTLVSTTGIDEALQGLSTDPYGRNIPSAVGLRVPPVLSGGITPPAQPRYLFALATREIKADTVIRGIRTAVTIGVDASSDANRVLPIEFPVTSPWWRFPDGNVSFHLIRESTDVTTLQMPSTNAASWRYKQTDQPAMIYDTATFSAGSFNPQTGAPLFYPVGLTAYKPPDINNIWQPIGNLGNMKGVLFPWEPQSDNKLNIPVVGNARITLYASVLQTNPTTRLTASLPDAAGFYPNGLGPEDAFVASWTGLESTLAPQYWRVYGSILFEDQFGAD